jgi:aspartyl-tRNA(Asn)/glutamyl-tRNA(Gln) amidotransferase subunit B
MPPLPNALKRKYIEELGLSEYDSSLLVDNKAIALYFEEMITYTKNYKSAANWLMGPVKSYLNQQAISISDFPVSAKHIATLIALIDSEKITNTMATQQVFPAMLKTPEKSPQKLAEELNLIVENDVDTLKAMINEVLNNYPEKVQAYKNGQKGLMGLFMGEVMKLSKGKANPKETTKLLNQLLNQ